MFKFSLSWFVEVQRRKLTQNVKKPRKYLLEKTCELTFYEYIIIYYMRLGVTL